MFTHNNSVVSVNSTSLRQVSVHSTLKAKYGSSQYPYPLGRGWWGHPLFSRPSLLAYVVAVVSRLVRWNVRSIMAVHLWLRAEKKPNERRTHLTPEKCKELVKAGKVARSVYIFFRGHSGYRGCRPSHWSSAHFFLSLRYFWALQLLLIIAKSNERTSMYVSC